MKIRFKYHVYISLACIVLASSLLLTDGYRFLNAPLLGAGLFFLILRVILIGGIVSDLRFKSPSIFLLIFVISTAFSSLYNDNDFTGFLLATGLYAIWIILSRFMVNMDGPTLLKYMLNITLITHVPLFFIGIMTHGIRLYSYEGFFYNPNSTGSIAATLFCALFSVVFIKIKEKKSSRFYTWGSYGLLLILFLFTIISSSRTSFLTIIFFSIFLFFYSSLFDKKIKVKAKSFASSIFGFLMLSLVLIVIYVYTPVGSIVDDAIIAKFEAKEESEDLTSGRDYIWRTTINDARLLGHGRGYFSKTFDIAGHNTFISMLGQNGIIASLSYLLFWLSILRASFIYLRSNMGTYRYLPFAVVLAFIILSMAEGMNGKLSMFLSFIAFSAINLKRYK